MIVLSNYLSPQSHASFMKGIPIAHLGEVKDYFKPRKIKHRIKYRGPRKHDGRCRDLQQSTCLKQNATHFAVYLL